MRILEYVEYAVSPVTKLAVCGLIGSALFCVYYWEPGKQQKEKDSDENGIMGYIEVDPSELSQETKLLNADGDGIPRTARNDTLENLDEYIKTLKQHHIRSVDEV